MSLVRLISPSFFTSKQNLLQVIDQSTANLIVLPTYSPSQKNKSLEYVFEYPSVEEIQAVLKKGQKVYCQQVKNGHAPKNVLVSRKNIESLGRECSTEEIAQQGDKFVKRLNKKRALNVRQHSVSFVFEHELDALNEEWYAHLNTTLLIYPQAIRPASWTKLGKTLKEISQSSSVAFVSLNDSTNGKTLSKIKTSTKLFNRGVENTDLSQWDGVNKLFITDIPLDD